MSRTTDVIEAITSMIRKGQLHPGDKLPAEPELMRELGMSRTPLREGVRALSLLGILETRQGDGTYVTDLEADSLFRPLAFASEIQSMTHPSDFLAARRALEVEVAGLAALGHRTEFLDDARAALAKAEDVLVKADVNHEDMLEADLEFHRALACAAGNAVITALLNALGSRTAGTRLWRERVVTGVSHRTHHEHLAIFAAVEDGDPERARTLMGAHLYGVEQFSRGHHG